MPKILVETISMHKMCYLIECETVEHAMDAVVCEEENLEAFNQEHIGENIFSTWVLSEEEVDNIIAESDNAHMGRKMIYKVDYSE
jgi:hypothetical protein